MVSLQDECKNPFIPIKKVAEKTVKAERKRSRKTRRIVGRVITWVIATPILLFALAIVLLYLPPVQDYAVKKATEYASRTTGFQIHIGSLHLHFPFHLTVKEVGVYSPKDGMRLGIDRMRMSVKILPLFKQNVEIDYIELTNATVNTGTFIDGMQLKGKIGNFRVSVRQIELPKQVATVKQLVLDNSQMTLRLTQKKDTVPEDTTSTPLNWKVVLARAKISHIDLALEMPDDTLSVGAHLGSFIIKGATADLGSSGYFARHLSLSDGGCSYDAGAAATTHGFNASHLRLSDIELNADSLYYHNDDIKAIISSFTLTEQSGLSIARCDGKVECNARGFNIPHFILETGNGSRVQARSTMPWNALETRNASQTGNALLECSVAKSDVELLTDSAAASYLKAYPDNLLILKAAIQGNTRVLALHNVSMVVPGIVNLNADGRLLYIADSLSRRADITFNAHVLDLNRIAGNPAAKLPTDTTYLSMDGDFSLERQQCCADINMKAGAGRINAQAGYNLANGNYQLNTVIENFSLQSLLRDIPLKQLTMQLNIDGQGTDPYQKSTNIWAGMDIASILYDSLGLKDLHLEASIDTAHSTLNLKSGDPRLPLTAKAAADLSPDSLKALLDLSMKPTDLHAFNLTTEPLTVAMNMSVRARTNFKDSHRISGKIKDITILSGKDKFTPDSISLGASTCPDSTRMRMRTGDFRLVAVARDEASAMTNQFSRIADIIANYLQRGDTVIDLEQITRLIPQTSLLIQCGDKNIIHDFISTQGYSFDKFYFKTTTDALTGINGETYLYGLRSDSLQLDTLRLFLKQDSSRIRYFGGVHSTSPLPGRQKETFGAFFNGTLYNRGTDFNFVYLNDKHEKVSELGLQATLVPNGINIHFNPQALLFSTAYAFNEDNYVRLQQDHPIQANVHFNSSDNVGFQFYSLPGSAKQDLSLELFNINLKEVTAALPFMPNLGGTLTTDVHYVEGDQKSWGCDLSIKNFTYGDKYIGNEVFEIVYLPQNETTHYVDVNMTHNDSHVLTLNGTYINEKGGSMDANMEVSHFPLRLANAFLQDAPMNLDGYLDGNMAVTGKTSSPDVNGTLRFDSVYMDIPMLGGSLHFNDKEELTITNSNLLFKNFSIYAQGKSPFTINGNVSFKNLSNPYMNLSMYTTNYELLNAKRNKISMVYGKIFMDFNARLTGYMNAINLNGRMGILGNTDITYVMRDAPLSVNNDLENLVTFKDFNKPADENEEVEDSTIFDLGSMSINLGIEVEQGARINADLDENRGSYVELEGGGNLNLYYTSEEGLSLTGRYSLSDGELKYTLPLIPLRTFTIANGSTLVWTGDMMNPTLDITATEKVTTSVTVDDVPRPATFDVGVKITNTLDNMGLSFIMSVPNDAAVQNEISALSQEDQSKYAVAMLITGVYLGSQGSLSASNAISSYLQSQIENITKSTLKSDVSFNVGVTSGQNADTGDSYTDYSFSFAKRFWNDRISVVIGGTVSDNNNQSKSQNQTFIDNVAIEWRLDQSGSRYLKLFFDKNNQSILEGEITETGMGYVVRKQFARLKDIFTFRKKKSQFPMGEEAGKEENIQ